MRESSHKKRPSSSSHRDQRARETYTYSSTVPVDTSSARGNYDSPTQTWNTGQYQQQAPTSPSPPHSSSSLSSGVYRTTDASFSGRESRDFSSIQLYARASDDPWTPESSRANNLGGRERLPLVQDRPRAATSSWPSQSDTQPYQDRDYRPEPSRGDTDSAYGTTAVLHKSGSIYPASSSHRGDSYGNTSGTARASMYAARSSYDSRDELEEQAYRPVKDPYHKKTLRDVYYRYG